MDQMPIEVLNEKLCSLLLILVSSRKELESSPNVSNASGIFFLERWLKLLLHGSQKQGLGRGFSWVEQIQT